MFGWGDLKFIAPFDDPQNNSRDQLGWYFGSRSFTKAGDLVARGQNDESSTYGLDIFYFSVSEIEVFRML